MGVLACVFVVWLLYLAAVAERGSEGDLDRGDESVARRSIRDLGSEDRRTAERAMWQLIALGPGILPRVMAAIRAGGSHRRIVRLCLAHWILAFGCESPTNLREEDLLSLCSFLDRVLARRPEWVEAWVCRGITRYLLEERVGAFKDWHAGVAADPRSPFPYFARGWGRAGAEDLAGAVEDLTAALERSSGFALAHRLRGGLRDRLGDAPGALEDYTCTIDLAPGDGGARFARGSARHRAGDLTGAREDLDRGLELDPANCDALLGRSRLRDETGDPEGALEDADRLVDLAPDSADARLLRGSLRFSAGRTSDALADFDAAVAADPASAWALTNRAACLRELGRTGEALAAVEEAIAVEPAHNHAYVVRGELRADRGDLAGAAEDCDRAAERGGNDAVTLNSCGFLQCRLGDHRRALAHFGAAISLDPRLALAHSNRAYCLLETGRLDDALASADRAVELDAVQTWGLFRRAQILAARGEREVAIRDLEDYLARARRREKEGEARALLDELRR